MPIVGGKHFPYTKKGKKDAKEAKMMMTKKQTKKKMSTSDGYMMSK